MNDIDWTGVIFGVTTLVLSAAILMVVLVQGGKYLQVRTERAMESRYTDLTQRYTELADGVLVSQASTGETLDDIRTRLTEIERMLREVE